MTVGAVADDAAMRAAALAGLQSGKSMRAVAVDLYGADQAAADWDCDALMRATVRRVAHRARASSGEGPGRAGPGMP